MLIIWQKKYEDRAFFIYIYVKLKDTFYQLARDNPISYILGLLTQS